MHDAPARGYRPDIDGLRGVAVLLVILFHAGLPWVPGGFVGVDVFFVISGFLISRIIHGEVMAGRFSYARFYRRRIKRILPAATIVALAVAAAGFALSLPDHLRNLGQSEVMTGLFATNILFWRESGYFTQAAELKPLLHSWSLGVEEQFYFLYPMVLILGLRLSRRWGGIAATALILTASLALSIWLTGIDRDAAFYLLPTRAWELMAGSMIALAPRGNAGRWGGALVAAGVALIAAAATCFSGATPFPGVAAIVPVLGAALIIAFGGHGDMAGRRLLENPPLQFFGRISYSLYLWHWPLLAFARYRSIDVPGPVFVAGLLVVATALSWLSWRFVEQPLRRHDRFTSWRPFAFAAGSSTLLIVIGGWFVASDGLPGRIDPEIRQILATARGERRAECLASEDRGWRDPRKACVFGADVAPSIAVWGDSHARAVVETLGQVAARQGRSVALYGYAGCAPIVGMRFVEPDFQCARFTAATLDTILANRAMRTIVIVARHGVYLRGLTTDLGPAERGKIQRSFIPRSMPGMRTAPRDAAYADRLAETVRRLRDGGKQVILLDPIPEVGYDVPRIIAILMRSGAPPHFDRPRAAYDRRQAPALSILRDVAAKTGAIVIPTASLFCDRTVCRTVEDRKLLYYDDNHVSPIGSEKIARAIWSEVAR